MAVFRVERNKGYTVMSNHHLRNKKLTLKAKGLLYAELFQSEDRRRCTVCGAAFASKSNSVKYCPGCRKRITRRQAAERMRKRRALVTQ